MTRHRRNKTLLLGSRDIVILKEAVVPLFVLLVTAVVIPVLKAVVIIFIILIGFIALFKSGL